MAKTPVIRELSWDDWNREHIKKHGVTNEEVAEVLAGEPFFRDTYKNRFAAIGPTFLGRMLVIIIGPDPIERDVYYVFSARPASQKERSLYQSALEGADENEQ